MKLIPDWKKAWRYFSMQSMGLAVAIQAAWLNIPDDLKATIDPQWISYGTMALLILGAVGRIVDQPDD